MVSQHAKSRCCLARVRRFGGKRRQCVSCRRTWTIRPRRRGRHRKRFASDLMVKVLRQGFSLSQLARRQPHRTLSTFRHHFRRLLRSYASSPRQIDLPDGPLILLLDGLWFRFKGRPWVLYQVALKPCRSATALFLDPTLLPGKETYVHWEEAIGKIPRDLCQRIVGITVDNLHGMRLLARHHNWVLQLCQFHLTMKLYGRRGMSPRALRGGQLRYQLKELVRNVLTAAPGANFDAAKTRLTELKSEQALSPRIRGLIRELCRNSDHYRAHIQHSHMGFPSTTNAVESMGARIRRCLHRHKAASSPEALKVWATAITRLSPVIVCNEGYQQN